ncbi:hypothetical protein L6V94_22245 [Klebsiella pneumoniae]|uniref:hypothetical protein n=1 Tax=Klebsiella pneumoniae TaxID=573 RepID=UPI001EE3D176|nr:hypothetical protein [Klebsiella pneumoniae]UKV67732.1 hypothetical protein L6V94_22245 [Klebsiella pneumoniae]
MTITLQTVNEIIASLESAGELSIREQKFLKLAKEFRICSASLDAAIKTGNVLADQNAQLAAENVEAKKIISECREYFIAGVMNRIRPTNEGYLHMICDTFADETPATDRIVAGIKAEAKSHDLNAFISHYSAELDNHIANGGDQFDERAVRLRGVIVGARMFREKLRDEEKVLALRDGDDK